MAEGNREEEGGLKRGWWMEEGGASKKEVDKKSRERSEKWGEQLKDKE